MLKTKLFACVLAASMMVASTQAHANVDVRSVPTAMKVAVWGTFACSALIILTAIAVSRTQGRELSSPEAWSCGANYWLRTQYQYR